MNRRTLLAGSIGLLAGCLGSLRDGSDHGSPSEAENCSTELTIEDVYPREVERTYIDYEYVALRNTADCTADVTGLTVDYGNGTEYTIPELELESGSQLAILSRDGENTTLATDPPAYIRSAAFDDGTETSVMDGSGVVTLRGRDGDVIDEASYNESTN